MAMMSLRLSSLCSMETLTLICQPSFKHPSFPRNPLGISRISSTLAGGTRRPAVASSTAASAAKARAFPISGAEGALIGFVTGRMKATEVAHLVWRSIVHKGDIVVDATCGNGHDTLALLRMVADGSGRGCVYGLDIQHSAIESTSWLLKESVEEDERELVKLFPTCHSKMETIIPKDTHVRLIAFNLGYLPGGDRTIITTPKTTLMALQAATRVLGPGGLISLVVYVGHPGGREELETVQSFASSLPTEHWVTSKFEILNRPIGPVLILMFRK